MGVIIREYGKTVLAAIITLVIFGIIFATPIFKDNDGNRVNMLTKLGIMGTSVEQNITQNDGVIENDTTITPTFDINLKANTVKTTDGAFLYINANDFVNYLNFIGDNVDGLTKHALVAEVRKIEDNTESIVNKEADTYKLEPGYYKLKISYDIEDYNNQGDNYFSNKILFLRVNK